MCILKKVYTYRPMKEFKQLEQTVLDNDDDSIRQSRTLEITPKRILIH